MATDCVLVYITTAGREEGERIARTLIERRLAACANMIPAVRSFYRWEGRLCDDEETLLLIKTTRDAYPLLLQAVAEMHSYSVPVVNAFAVEAGNEAYLAWVRKAVTAEAE